MNWFGEPWGAPVNEINERCATPIGEFCDRCEQPIKSDDRGFRIPYASDRGGPLWVYYHLLCLLAAIGVEPAHKRN